MLNPIFVSHGSPSLPFEDVEARSFLQGLGADVAKPRAILMVSAHWDTQEPTVNAVAVNETIHDFYNFPEALYQLRYPAPGDPSLAQRVQELLKDAGFTGHLDPARGLDHGAWAPLLLAWPEADIPVVQLSVQSHMGAKYHMELGRALRPLLNDGVLIMGSGGFTHNLAGWRQRQGDEEPEWVSTFADWFNAALAEGRIDDILAYRERAPYGEMNHPTEEHLLPLFVTLGAAGDDASVRQLHSSNTYGILRMEAFSFGP